jgi:outer membrane lipoprotein LolB
VTRRTLALLAVLAGLTAGCASTPPLPGETPWMTGRLSLRVDASPGAAAQSLSAGFELRGTGADGELRLNSPLGTRLASARWQPGSAMLTTPDGQRSFDSLDALSRGTLGESLPLAALPDWMSGRPWADAAHRATDSGFEQLGWQVVLTRLAEGQIEARRAAAPAVLLRVRLDNGAS